MYERIYCIEQLEGLDGDMRLAWMQTAELNWISYGLPDDYFYLREVYIDKLAARMDMTTRHLYLVGKKPQGV